MENYFNHKCCHEKLFNRFVSFREVILLIDICKKTNPDLYIAMPKNYAVLCGYGEYFYFHHCACKNSVAN